MNKCPNCGHDHKSVLTPRELEAVMLLAEALPDKIIAYRMGITYGSVKVYLAKAYRKLGVRGRVQAAFWARDRQEKEEKKQA